MDKREEVINDYSCRDSKAEKVETIDAGLVLFVVLVKKDLLDAISTLSKSSTGRQEPTVSRSLALNDILMGDSVSEQSGIWEGF